MGWLKEEELIIMAKAAVGKIQLLHSMRKVGKAKCPSRES